MSNLVKAKALKDSLVFYPDQTSFNRPMSLKSIAYPMLVRNVNPLPYIRTNFFEINGNVVNIYPGFYQFSDLIGIITDALLVEGTSCSVNVTGPNSYTISNSGADPTTIKCTKNFSILTGLPEGTLTINPSETVGNFNMNVTLGARVIEIKVSGLKNTICVPIYSYYGDQVFIVFPNKLKFFEDPKTDLIKEVTMSVDYVAIETSETLKTFDTSRILFALE